ncbi:MAG TPA: type IV-A pilus assembly ATPase PilB [Candidatus Methylomirabilis sp.]|nr:type IV-A pilus assembly ATPase PilB [Candidatus Methylomirabilis sp.]HSC71575.1 type IV-A pilus assembly ATPase PilB [Candidatus Methylomirabilis sp.]
MAAGSARLGDMLVKAALINKEQLSQALQQQQTAGGRIGTNLVKLGFISEDDITSFLSRQYGVPSINLSHFEIDGGVIKLIPSEIAQKHQVIPINRTGNVLTVAMADPSNIFAIDDIKFMTGFKVEPVVAAETSIKNAINKHYDSAGMVEDIMKTFDDKDVEALKEGEDGVNVAELGKAAEDAPVVKLVNLILTDAIKKGASDIHIEPYEKSFRVRYRIDGVLYDVMQPPTRLKAAITSRIKIMSQLDIAERRLPQDGRIKIKMGGKEMDYRVSTLPTLFGEKAVLRLLDKGNLQLDMTKLGFDPQALADFEGGLLLPYGMVLVTGPTGSGKTTTLYSALNRLNTTETNIMTAEDPVEFNLTGINQVQTKAEIGLTFAAALRSFLRQDPDIIMVGEIRDYETAEIGVKAALTGHLVLSTLHTNDAPSTISRLLNMGVEPFLVSASTNVIVAQRLARRVCQACKEIVPVPPQALVNLGFGPEEAKTIRVYKGKGCMACSETGYKGRVALYEVMLIKENIKEAILQGASAMELRELGRTNGMRTLREAGLQKILEGMTTIEEILRVTTGN